MGRNQKKQAISQSLRTWLISLLSLSSISFFFPSASCHSFNYKQALSHSLLYFESQRSGHLPHNQRATWRHHSGLTDGLEQGVDLVGGYYDAGDNVKFGLPMAFTITLLSWGVIEYGHLFAGAGEYSHALEAIKWGTDYFIKAHTHPHVLWAQVTSCSRLLYALFEHYFFNIIYSIRGKYEGVSYHMNSYVLAFCVVISIVYYSVKQLHQERVYITRRR